MKLIEEKEHHFLLAHPEGHQIVIAKAPLSESMREKIRKRFEGGGEISVDKSKAQAVQDSFNNASIKPVKAMSVPQPKPKAFAEGTKEPIEQEKSEEPSAEENAGDLSGMNRELASNQPESVPAKASEPYGLDMIKNMGKGIGNAIGDVYNAVNSTQIGHSLLSGTVNEPPPNIPSAAKQEVQQNETFDNSGLLDTGQQQQQPNQVQNVDYAQPQQKSQGQLTASEVTKSLDSLESKNKNQVSQLNPMQQYQDSLKSLQQEYLNNEQSVKNGTLDPMRVFHNMGTGQKITTAIGMLLGGIASANGQKNPVLEMVNQAIDRDIEAQKAELGKNNTLLEANLRHYGNLRDAVDASTLQMKAAFDGMLGKQAAYSLGPLARANYENAITQSQLQSQALGEQMAMRRSIYGQMMNSASQGQQAHVDPALAIRMLVPEKEHGAAFKELNRVTQLKRSGEDALRVFDDLNGQALGGAFSPNQKKALIDPIAVALARDAAGRVNDYEFHSFQSLFPSSTDGPGTREKKRAELARKVNEKMDSFLTGYGVPVPRIDVPNYRKVPMTAGLRQASFKK